MSGNTPLQHETPRQNDNFVATRRLYAEFKFLCVIDATMTETVVPLGNLGMVGGRHERRWYRRMCREPVTARSPM
jgi:hypothetical protein